MQYTTNYSLKKPQYGDTADIADINDNSDSVDNLIHQNRTMIAPAFDSTKAYVIGDPVVYLGELFVFIADKAAGAWDATKVEPTTAAEMGGGGASALADLDDVEITSPTDGQALLYDDSDDKWKNGTLPDVSVTKEASGNPIELTDAASAPLVKCVTQITGSQDLHGYDKPWVGGVGKNICPIDSGSFTPVSSWISLSNVSANTYSNGTAIYLSAGTYTYSFTDTVNFNTFQLFDSDGNNLLNKSSAFNSFTISTSGTFYIRVKVTDISATFTFKIQIESGNQPTLWSPYENICPITAYTEGEIEVRGKNLANKDDFVVGSIDSSGNDSSSTTRLRSPFIFIDNTKNYSISCNTEVSIYEIDYYGVNKNWLGYTRINATEGHYTPSSETYYIKILVRYLNNDNISVSDLTKFQLEVGSTATTYEPYTSTTHTTTYPSAIYRGSEDCVNGTETHEMLKKTFDGTESWTKYDTGQGTLFRYSVSGIKPGPQQTITPNLLCSHYQTVANNTRTNKTISQTQNETAIDIIDNDYSDTTTFAAAMSGMEIAYELATPTTSSVTPTNLPIKSLSGYSHIESSTGDMEVEYITSEYQPLVDLIQSGNGHTYSTQEQVVGKWIDGHEIYEKTFVIDNTVSGSWAQVAHGISNLDLVVSMNGFFKRAGDGNMFPLWVWEDVNTFIVVEVSATNIEYKSKLTTGTMYVTIRYTKSTQTRSLSAPVNAQKAIPEPLTDKTEEVPTEEEKTAEKPETEEENNER